MDNAINCGAVIIALIILILGIKKIPFAYWVYGIVLALFPAFTAGSVGSLRYLAAVFPIVLILATFGEKENTDKAITVCFALLQGALFVFWVSNYWFIS